MRGVTAGHFAAKLDEKTFLTSRRKTDFNDMRNVGLVKVRTDGPDSVIAYGSKPSVGGQSQRIVFTEHSEADCIVHFHCEKKPGSRVPTISQREYECGSHECGRNTSRGLRCFGNLLAVYLEHHGPNLVFNKDIDPQEVINFIEANFDLDTKTHAVAYRLQARHPAFSTWRMTCCKHPCSKTEQTTALSAQTFITELSALKQTSGRSPISGPMIDQFGALTCNHQWIHENSISSHRLRVRTAHIAHGLWSRSFLACYRRLLCTDRPLVRIVRGMDRLDSHRQRMWGPAGARKI